MALPKDITSSINTTPVYGAIAEATADPAQDAQEALLLREEPQEPAGASRYTEQEALQYMNNLQTTGRKGLKLPRINLAFAPDVYQYIRHMSRVKGVSMTEFVDAVLRQHMDDHRDIYEKAIEFMRGLE